MDNLLGRENPELIPLAESNLILAELINDFFITKVNTREALNSLESSSEILSYPDLSSILQPSNIKMDTFSTASVSEVSKIIKNSSKASCSLDPLPTSLVSQLLPHLAPIITEIVNKSLSSGIFPSS